MTSVRLKKNASLIVILTMFVVLSTLYAFRRSSTPSVVQNAPHAQGNFQGKYFPAQTSVKTNAALRGRVDFTERQEREILSKMNLSRLEDDEKGLDLSEKTSVEKKHNITMINTNVENIKRNVSNNENFNYNKSSDEGRQRTNRVNATLPLISLDLSNSISSSRPAYDIQETEIPPAATKCEAQKVEIVFQENGMMAEVGNNSKSLLLERLNDLRLPERTLSRGAQNFPDWFSSNDVEHMHMMFSAAIDDVYTIQYHPQLKVLVFDSRNSKNVCEEGTVPIQRCPRCGLRKQPNDTDEIFAFHLDRVLGINRTPPAVARIFRDFRDPSSEEDVMEPPAPTTSTTSVYPIMWWDPEVVHDSGDDAFMQDQNSLSISWLRYQRMLWNFCWIANSTPKADEDCPIYHQDWVKMALFDFLLQNHDRLDRGCCGYVKDIGDNLKCFTEGQHCTDTPDVRWLVHIFTRSSDPHRLVFIDNKLNTLRNGSDLNYKLLEGITSMPSTIAEKLRSDNLRELLFESLRYDRVYWNDVLNGERGAVKLWNIIKERINALLDYANKHGLKTLD